MKAIESVAVVMPAWNEEAGIVEFLTEIRDSFETKQVFFVVVDDASSDNSVAILRQLEKQGFPVRISQNGSLQSVTNSKDGSRRPKRFNRPDHEVTPCLGCLTQRCSEGYLGWRVSGCITLR